MPFFLTSLHSRLWLAATLGLVLTLLIQLGLSDGHFRQVADGLYQQKMQRQAEFLAANMDWMERATLTGGDREWLDEQLEDSVAAAYPLRRDPATGAISIAHKPSWRRGHLPARPLDPAGLATMRDPLALDQTACVCQGHYVATVRGGQYAVQVAVRTEASGALFAAFRSGTLVSVGAAVLVLLAFGGWVSLRVTRPLTHLSRQVAQPGAARLPYLQQQDEVGILARALEHSRLETAQARAQELRFLAVASHELRTPLAALLTHLERAKLEGTLKPRPDPRGAASRDEGRRVDKRAASLDQAIETVLRLRALSANLLALSQPADRGATVPLDLFTLAAQVVDEWQLAAAEQGIELDLAGHGAPMLGDPFGLEQLLTNLISNALKYTDAGQIDVSVLTAQDGVMLTVRDTGRGLPDRWETLTEPFRRGTGIAALVPGTGLGLAVVTQVVRQHGGTVQGTALRRGGTEITVHFPVGRP